MYVDGVVIPVKRDRIAEYAALAQRLADIWIDHGALSVVDSVADDVPEGAVTSFARAVRLEPDEVVVFSWITFHDRAQRDAVTAAAMADPRIDWPDDPPMNGRRMIWGGFRPLVARTAGA